MSTLISPNLGAVILQLWKMFSTLEKPHDSLEIYAKSDVSGLMWPLVNFSKFTRMLFVGDAKWHFQIIEPTLSHIMAPSKL